MCGCSFPDNSVHMTVGRFSAPDEWVLAGDLPVCQCGTLCPDLLFKATTQLTIVVIMQQNRGGQLTSRRPYIFREVTDGLIMYS